MAASRGCGGTAHLLPAERARATFPVEALRKIMGTDKLRAAVDAARALFAEASDPNNDPEGVYACFREGADALDDYRSYAEQLELQLERTAKAVRLTRENPSFMAAHASGKIQMKHIFHGNGLAAIHFTMGLSFIKNNASEAQKKLWLPRCMEASMFVAYAQTELGHGSNVRGLETLATFCPESDEIELHSPTLTSLKFWPTGLYACTHAIVFAQLQSQGRQHGAHGFMVQLRDAEGRLMPGVEVGEIGPKIIGGHTNIGFARFTRVRVPRAYMLSKLFQLTREGEFRAPPAAQGKIKGVTMMMMRVFNVRWAAGDAAAAATIATRYSCVRAQGFKDTVKGDAGSAEHIVMDYRMQQLRVLSATALATTLFWNAAYLETYLARVQDKINRGDASAADELPELHATLSGLKAFATTRAHDAIEECRRACGGQGFLRSSGVADLACSFAEPVTVEGEQVILSLQTSRFLVKSVKQRNAGAELLGSVHYLREAPLRASDLRPRSWRGQHALLLAMLRDRAARSAERLERRFAHAQKQGRSFDEATNETAVAGYEAAAHHSAFICARNLLAAIDELVPKDNAPVQAVLLRLAELQMLVWLREGAEAWFGLLDREAADAMFERTSELLGELRPDAVALTDAFGASDYSLASTLGRSDGNVYEAIMQEARLSPLNASPVMVGWDKLAPILDLDFLRDARGQRALPLDEGHTAKL